MKFKVVTRLRESALVGMFTVIIITLIMIVYTPFMLNSTKQFGFAGGIVSTIIPVFILLAIVLGVEVKEC